MSEFAAEAAPLEGELGVQGEQSEAPPEAFLDPLSETFSQDLAALLEQRDQQTLSNLQQITQPLLQQPAPSGGDGEQVMHARLAEFGVDEANMAAASDLARSIYADMSRHYVESPELAANAVSLAAERFTDMAAQAKNTEALNEIGGVIDRFSSRLGAEVDPIAVFDEATKLTESMTVRYADEGDKAALAAIYDATWRAARGPDAVWTAQDALDRFQALNDVAREGQSTRERQQQARDNQGRFVPREDETDVDAALRRWQERRDGMVAA